MKKKLLDVNTATALDLMKLKGIGSSTALAIVDHREKHGPFKTIQDLYGVKGVGSHRAWPFRYDKRNVVRLPDAWELEPKKTYVQTSLGEAMHPVNQFKQLRELLHVARAAEHFIAHYPNVPDGTREVVLEALRMVIGRDEA